MTRKEAAQKAAERCSLLASLLAALTARLHTADALEAEGGLTIVKEFDKHWPLIRNPGHVLARGKHPDDE
jgi:hypothetical protein